VEDAVAATYLVATTPACDEETIHVGNSQEEIAIEALAKLIMAELGVSAEILECEGRPGSVMRRCPDTSKLKRLTGFEAKVALKDGLSRTCRWYLNHSGA
jgi:nucleoside-diphosphate-sugar epimerase